MTMTIADPAEVVPIRKKIAEAAAVAVAAIERKTSSSDPMGVLWALKFEKLGADPLDPTRALNVIEQVNQCFTYLVALQAVEYLLEHHPVSAPFLIHPSTASGPDVESSDGRVHAEVFAAVHPSNNRKLARDVRKATASSAEYRYVFYSSPHAGVASEQDGVRIRPVAIADGRRPGEPAADLEELIEFCTSDGRVCPMPPRWNEFWEMLPGRHGEAGSWMPPPPLILGSWHYASDDEKRPRLREHLRWAADHQFIATADQFLRSLPDSDWHRRGEI